MQEIQTGWETLEVGDGTTLDGYLARPVGNGQWPALIVLQEIFGVNDHIRDLTERFAREGYVAFAPDLFHRLGPRYEGSYEDIPASMKVANRVTGAEIELDLKATGAYLEAHPAVKGGRIGAIGYCMGGRQAFRANLVLPLKAAVSYYGAGITTLTDQVNRLSGPTLFIWAGKDPYIPPAVQNEVTEALRGANKPFVNVEFSDVDHGFFCDARSNYDARAAAVAWPLTLGFLATHLKR